MVQSIIGITKLELCKWSTYNKLVGIQHESTDESMILEIDSLLFFYLLLIDIILCHIRDKTLAQTLL